MAANDRVAVVAGCNVPVDAAERRPDRAMARLVWLLFSYFYRYVSPHGRIRKVSDRLKCYTDHYAWVKLLDAADG